MKDRPGDQPLPTPNDARDIQSMVIDDIGKRRSVGIERYGTALQPNNGRDALRDAYEEALDLCMYLKQAMVERDESVDIMAGLKERIAEFESHIGEQTDG